MKITLTPIYITTMSRVDHFIAAYATKASNYCDDPQQTMLNIVEIDEQMFIGAIPRGKADLNNADQYRRNNRPAKLLPRILRPDLLVGVIPSDWEKLTIGLQALVIKKPKFEIVSGDDIAYWYDENHYAYGSGALNSSCMRYEESQIQLALYCCNPKTVKMLIAKNQEEELQGRALLWELDNGRTFMDRVYSNRDVAILFKNYAIEKEWIFYDDRGYRIDSKTMRGYDAPITALLDSTEHMHMPYRDSMQYLYKDGISTSSNKTDELGRWHGPGKLSEWEATRVIEPEEPEYPCCTHCGDEIHGAYPQMVHDEYVCEDCINDYYAYCNQCGEYHSNDHLLGAESIEVSWRETNRVMYHDTINLCPHGHSLSEEHQECSSCSIWFSPADCTAKHVIEYYGLEPNVYHYQNYTLEDRCPICIQAEREETWEDEDQEEPEFVPLPIEHTREIEQVRIGF